MFYMWMYALQRSIWNVDTILQYTDTNDIVPIITDHAWCLVILRAVFPPGSRHTVSTRYAANSVRISH